MDRWTVSAQGIRLGKPLTKRDPSRCHYFERLGSGGGGGGGTAEPVDVSRGFATRLEEIQREKFPRFPFYGVILCTSESEFDSKIQKHIADKWEYLHRMTGEACLVFAVAGQPSRRVKARQTFDDAAIYDIARRLGVPASALPCVVFFPPPTTEAIETVIVRFADHVPPSAEPTATQITRIFRGMATALETCQGKQRRSRMGCLRKELAAALRPAGRGRVSGALEVAGRSSENVNKTIVAAQAVASVLTVIASRLLGAS